jgi:Ser/Thr protein kinase RdoA (MazF antagonist)
LAQHWLLLADAGRPLHEVLGDGEQVQVFPPLLARYAALQIASTRSVEHLLALGLPDRRLEHLAASLQALLTDQALEAVRSPAAKAGIQAAADLLPSLIRVCNELAESAYSETLDHGDLHRGNVLAANGRYRLIDWGDACLTHPFCSIMLPLETLLQHVPQADRLRWAFYLRDAYLEPWETFAPRRQLVADFEQALWVAHLLRALNMAHMFAAADEATLNRWRPMIFGQLENWVAHHAWLGRGLAGWLHTLPSA